MSENELRPKPDAEIEPGEPNPGGVDAVAQADGVDGEDATGDPLPRDADPEDNPVTGEIPLGVKTGEDTSTAATDHDTSDVAEQESSA